MIKIHLGCGERYFKNWTNIDIEAHKLDIKQDIRKPLPFENNSVDFIYNEHVLEHFIPTDGIQIIKNCYKILKPNGVLRTACPDLFDIVHKYLSNWRDQDWIINGGHDFIRTKAEMLNMCFSSWGHKWMYDEEEMQRRLKEGGFSKLETCKHSKSKYTELSNLETRINSILIIEATK